MPRTITVTIHEPYIAILEKWASVGRTLQTARKCCEDADMALDDREIEKYHFCAEELKALIPALEHLHYQARTELWKEVSNG